MEAASWVEPDNDRTVLIDASTAFRVNEDWPYGFPGRRIISVGKGLYLLVSFVRFLRCDSSLYCTELSKEQREKLSKSKRIANPGCYPTGFIGLTRPLVDAGIIPPGTPLTINAISGYTGGGKGLMAIYESDEEHEPWGSYGFSLVCALSAALLFTCFFLAYPSFFLDDLHRNTSMFRKWPSIRDLARRQSFSRQSPVSHKAWWCRFRCTMRGWHLALRAKRSMLP